MNEVMDEMNVPLRDLPVRELLERLASSQPVPGGGSAAALAGALAAGLVSMVCRLTLGRERFAAVEDQAKRLLEQSEQHRHELERAIDDDAQAYEQVALAYRLPRQTAEQQAARSQAIQQATRAAAAPPLEIAARCGQVLDLAQAGVDILNPSAISDIEVATHLAWAGLQSALANVEINVRGLKDASAVSELRTSMEVLSKGREAQTRWVMERARARLP